MWKWESFLKMINLSSEKALILGARAMKKIKLGESVFAPICGPISSSLFNHIDKNIDDFNYDLINNSTYYPLWNRVKRMVAYEIQRELF